MIKLITAAPSLIILESIVLDRDDVILLYVIILPWASSFEHQPLSPNAAVGASFPSRDGLCESIDEASLIL